MFHLQTRYSQHTNWKLSHDWFPWTNLVLRLHRFWNPFLKNSSKLWEDDDWFVQNTQDIHRPKVEEFILKSDWTAFKNLFENSCQISERRLIFWLFRGDQSGYLSNNITVQEIAGHNSALLLLWSIGFLK